MYSVIEMLINLKILQIGISTYRHVCLLSSLIGVIKSMRQSKQSNAALSILSRSNCYQCRFIGCYLSIDGGMCGYVKMETTTQHSSLNIVRTFQEWNAFLQEWLLSRANQCSTAGSSVC